MSELEDRINSVLSDPEQLARISAMAQSLMGSPAADQSVEGHNAASLGNAASPENTVSLGKLGELLHGAMGEKNPRLAALEALAACLDERRREKLRRALRLSRVLRLAQAGLLGAEDGHV
ncbi:MAG: hypothetical protein IJP64_05085 [Oscillospiraceae bacterium]|nr:hypothetical protein [Oscillospiraceae bacterium]